jgi:hypothetical protein
MPGAKQIFPEKFALCLEHGLGFVDVLHDRRSPRERRNG